MLDEHRDTIKANKNLADTTNRDNQNWRDMMNDKNHKQNWRAAVNDRLNYQGQSSPSLDSKMCLSWMDSDGERSPFGVELEYSENDNINSMFFAI